MSTIITKRQFPNYHKYEMELAGRPLTMELRHCGAPPPGRHRLLPPERRF